MTPAPIAAASQNSRADMLAATDITTTKLDDALARYRSGDQAGAVSAAADAYEDGFELIEGPLVKVDAKLKEDLETLISQRLRQAMQANESVDVVAGLIADAKVGLAKARRLLG